MDKRLFLKTCTGLVTSLFTKFSIANNNPIKIIVGFQAGGNTDSLARVIGTILSESLGRPVIIENKPGASGRIAVEYAAASKPDGSTLLISPQGPLTLFPQIFENLKYSASQFTPVTGLGASDIAIVIGPNVPANNFIEFIKWVKNSSTPPAYASPGNGTVMHFAGVILGESIGKELIHVPYQGGTRQIMDLAGGSIPIALSNVTEAMHLHNQGRVKIIATMGGKRSKFTPTIPTLIEMGHKINITGWTALYSPNGVDNKILDEYSSIIAASINKSSVQEMLASQGLEPYLLATDEVNKLIESESGLWRKAISTSKFSAT